MTKNNTSFKKGNKLWQLREYPGRPKLFETPEELWDAAVLYFDWCEDNSLFEEKVFCNQGEIINGSLTHMRAMTIQGLCLHMGIGSDCFAEYSKRPDYVGICEHIRYCIYEQKLTGAAAGLLNPSIIVRELGLAERIEQTTEDLTKRDLSKLTDKELKSMNEIEDKLDQE